MYITYNSLVPSFSTEQLGESGSDIVESFCRMPENKADMVKAGRDTRFTLFENELFFKSCIKHFALKTDIALTYRK